VQFLTPSKRKEIMSSWYDEAACKGMDPELFFPQTKGIVSHFKDLRRRCENCTVRDECEDQVISELVFCVNIREHKVGFRAGMSEKRLKNIAISIRKDRAKERAA